jgi:hypothetical protein
MTYYISYLKDTLGNNYIGINIYPEAVEPYIQKMKDILGDEAQEFIDLQKNRDHGKYHITVINVMDYNKLSKEMGVDKFVDSLEKVFDYPIDDLKFMGLGTAEKNGNRAYFVVIDSDQLQSIRKRYDLPNQDFHITLGFKWKDIFGIRKNQVLPEVDPFLKLLKNEYYKNNETFDFVKTLTNFDGNQDDDVDPIKIEDTYATFRIGKNRYYTVSLIGGNLIISAKWEDSSDKQILSNTLIYRKLKK